MLRITLVLSFIFSSLAIAREFKGYEIDNKETDKKYKVELKSGKKKSVRFYQGFLSKTFNMPLEFVMKSITNFEDKCNNDYKDRRELISKKKDCTYHNGNIVESKLYRDLKNYKKEENEIDRFLIARRVYNRQEFTQVDLAQVFETKNEQGQRVVKILTRMIGDKKVKKYLKKLPVENDTVFLNTYSDFILTEINKGQTRLDYTYTSQTDHWLLNKSVSVSKVFAGMAKGIDLLFYSIKKELAKYEAKKVIKSTAVAIKRQN
jgi:hypothetical protein